MEASRVLAKTNLKDGTRRTVCLETTLVSEKAATAVIGMANLKPLPSCFNFYVSNKTTLIVQDFYINIIKLASP